MELIVITPDNSVINEAETVNQLLDAGLQRLHIRKSHFTKEDYREYIRAIKSEYHLRIVIHGYFDLFHELSLGGIHLNTAARNDDTLKEQIGNISSSFISTSFHSWKEIVDNEFPYRYVFISPVFDSISKAGYKAGIDLNGAMETKQELKRNNKYCQQIIGLGGVGVSQVETLHLYGFDGAAMLGAIWMAEEPVAVFKDSKHIAGVEVGG